MPALESSSLSAKGSDEVVTVREIDSHDSDKNIEVESLESTALPPRSRPSPRPPRTQTQPQPWAPPRRTGPRRTVVPVILVLGYSAMALFAWVVTCILAVRPITISSYAVELESRRSNSYGNGVPEGLLIDYRKNHRWFQAARIVQSVVAVITLPLATSVLGAAAVIYVQRSGRRLTLRQLISLADEGWSDVRLAARLVSFWRKRHWNVHGSPFLLFAGLLYIIGGVLAPLQEYLLDTRTIKVPTFPMETIGLMDIEDGLEPYDDERDGLVASLVRSALTSTSSVEPQTQLWQGGNFSCASKISEDERSWGWADFSESCRLGNSFHNLSRLTEPFLSQLPNSYNTGVIRQFAPRFNSTATYQKIAAEDFPHSCESIQGGFWADYGIESQLGGYGSKKVQAAVVDLQACMPADLRSSPWNRTRDRQDFGEELYLNITLDGFKGFLGNGSTKAVPRRFTQQYKLTVNTTAGFFELPNYMNGQVAGPLLDRDPGPAGLCGSDCRSQGRRYDDDLNRNIQGNPTDKRANVEALETVHSKGPLLIVAQALFGRASYLETRTSKSAAFGSYLPESEGPRFQTAPCGYIAPMKFLLADRRRDPYKTNIPGEPCVPLNSGGENGKLVGLELADWLWDVFVASDAEAVGNAFSAAALLTLQKWLFNGQNSWPTLTVNYDLGADAQVPSISRRSVILFSTLLGLYLLGLFAAAIYAAWVPAWTQRMDSWAVMRITAGLADSLPDEREARNVTVLDELRSCVGPKGPSQSGTSEVTGHETGTHGRHGPWYRPVYPPSPPTRPSVDQGGS